MKTWKEFLELRIKGLEKNIPWFLHDKLKCYEFCRNNNIDTVNLYDVFNNPEEITFKNAPCMEFVLKPTLDSSTRGVMVLKRCDSSYYDSMKNKSFSFEEIIQYQSELFVNNKNKNNKIMLEEKIVDRQFQGIPRDYKAYAFRGKIALIVEIDRNTKPSTSVWYDGEFNIISEKDIKHNPKFSAVRSAPRRPDNWEEMLSFFKKVSSLVPTPFARIDIYDTSNGFVLGEVTLAPGALYYGVHYEMSIELNEYMGSLWSEALISN